MGSVQPSTVNVQFCQCSETADLCGKGFQSVVTDASNRRASINAFQKSAFRARVAHARFHFCAHIFRGERKFLSKKGNDESSKIQPCWTAIRPQNQNLGEVRVVFVLSIFVQEQPKAWHSQSILCGPDKV